MSDVLQLLIVGGAPVETSTGDTPEWEGYRCTCLPRARASFCDLREGVWTARIDVAMLDAFVTEAASFDAVFCETGEALLLVTEWERRGIPPRPILALEVDGILAVDAFAAWYRATHGVDPVPRFLATRWVSWVATSEAQASRLEARGVDPTLLHRVPTGASVLSMVSSRAEALLAQRGPPTTDVELTAGRVLFPGNGRRDWSAILDAVFAMPDLPCTLIGGSVRDVERRIGARSGGSLLWPANLRHAPGVPLERYIELVRAAKVAVVPLLPGPGDGGHSTIAIVQRLGVPLVCTDSPALSQYVDRGRAARLCLPGSAADLVRAIREVVSDSALAASLALAGQRSEQVQDLAFRREMRRAIERARAELAPRA